MKTILKDFYWIIELFTIYYLSPYYSSSSNTVSVIVMKTIIVPFVALLFYVHILN
jgi:hypothetical protein